MRGRIEVGRVLAVEVGLGLEVEITLRRLECRGDGEREGEREGEGEGEGERDAEGAYAGAVSESDALAGGERSRSLVAALRAAAR